MGYQYRGKQAPAVMPIEQARRINAELRRELAALTAENADLEPKVDAMRRGVTAARKKLARQIRDIEVARIQTRNIAALAATPTAPESVYGGREGLQAAADEIEAHEAAEGAKLGTVRRRGPRHGTGRKYSLGCRCEECQAWRKRKSAAERATQNRRRDEYRALKAAAEVA